MRLTYPPGLKVVTLLHLPCVRYVDHNLTLWPRPTVFQVSKFSTCGISWVTIFSPSLAIVQCCHLLITVDHFRRILCSSSLRTNEPELLTFWPCNTRASTTCYVESLVKILTVNKLSFLTHQPRWFDISEVSCMVTLWTWTLIFNFSRATFCVWCVVGQHYNQVWRWYRKFRLSMVNCVPELYRAWLPWPLDLKMNLWLQLPRGTCTANFALSTVFHFKSYNNITRLGGR